MDTVTEAALAIAMRRRAASASSTELTAHGQAAEVAKVKRFESGVLRDPIRSSGADRAQVIARSAS